MSTETNSVTVILNVDTQGKKIRSEYREFEEVALEHFKKKETCSGASNSSKKLALIKAVIAFTESEQFNSLTYDTAGSFTIDVKYILNLRASEE